MAKLYAQLTSICIEKENKKYIAIYLCTYLKNETEEINWVPLGGALDN